MLKKFDKKDIDIIMNIWKENTQKLHDFSNGSYWSDNYLNVKNMFLNNDIYVYTETNEILAYVVINNSSEILDIQVHFKNQREGIGKLLIKELQKNNDELLVNVGKKNNIGVLFFKANNFKKLESKYDEGTKQEVYYMKWKKEYNDMCNFIYFDSSIERNLVDLYGKNYNIQFYNINTINKECTDGFSINLTDSIDEKNKTKYIKDYVRVRNEFNSIIKGNATKIYFDCNNNYNYLFEIIKDVVSVKKVPLTILMHKPLVVDGTKKIKLYEEIRNVFKGYNIIDVDYENISNNLNITFKQAFKMRNEEMLKMICKL